MNDSEENGELVETTVIAEGTVATVEAEPAAASRLTRLASWRRVFRGNRVLWVTTVIAVVALIAGMLVGKFVISPADAAANAQAPDPGYITVPVAFGELRNDVVIRADVGYADATEVTIDTASISGGSAVVTGQVPEVGAELAALSVALEVVGRPVIVLPGDLPPYRTLRFGVSGPDVVQLKTALRAVGIEGGDPASALFDGDTANGIAQLYAAAGYPVPTADDAAAGAVSAAQAGVNSANQSVVAAEAELRRAQSGPNVVEVTQADNEIRSAQRALQDARTAGASASEIANLEDAVSIAQLRRQQLAEPPDTSAAQASLDSAIEGLRQAETELARAQEGALPFLPSSEVVYFSTLPRRVDAVNAQRGQVLKGVAMTVSGATVRLTGSAGEADARLLAVGGEAFFDLPDGSTQKAVITALAPSKSKDAAGRWSIELEPESLSAEQIQQLQGTNVRLEIPVGATDGEVLSVPLAALTAGPGGESRVEVVDGDPRDPTTPTRLVTVKTGLAAGGVVEVEPLEGSLEKDDLVVVGQ